MIELRSCARAVADWALHTEASTRTSALLRMGLAAVLWSRWGHDLLLYAHLADGRWPFCVAFFVVTTLAFIGLWSRFAVAACAACAVFLVYYVGHFEKHWEFVEHNTTLLTWALVWLSFTPSDRSYSLDRWLSLRRAEQRGLPAPQERGNLWGLRLVALQVAAVYLWTAFDKCNVAFLNGTRLQNIAMNFYTGSSLIEGTTAQLFVLAAWLTVALELALAFGLLFRRTRRWLVIPGLLLHGVMYMTLQVFTFTVTMWLLYLAFFDADEVHRVLDRIQGVDATRLPPAG
jgi:hypothetical protein